MAMRRADRRDSNYDNEIKYPRAKKKEPVPLRELEQRFLTVQSQRDEWRQKAQENQSAATELVDIKPKFQILQSEVQQWEKKATNNYHLYCEEQQEHQKALSLYTQEKDRSTELLAKYEKANIQRDEWKQKAQENESAATELVDIKPKFQILQSEVQQWEKKATHNYHLYCEEQQQHQKTLSLYTQEKDRSTELLTKYEEANAQKEQYLSLYNETKTELKQERYSKAGIKGWETRRKRENERLKREIGEMTLILRDSLERKEEAVNNLYILADRMDRIQNLVDSVQEESSNTPVALLEKLKRIWVAIREILTE